MTDIDRSLAAAARSVERSVNQIAPLSMDRLEQKVRHRRIASATVAVTAVIGVLVGASMLPSNPRDGLDAAGSVDAPATTAATAAAAACPITVPEVEYVPPAPYPAAPPAAYRSMWYGTDRLWTMIESGGAVWPDLPEHDGLLSQKTFWWSSDFSPANEPRPEITLTARLVGSPAVVVTSRESTTGSHTDLGTFILAGIELPSPGCWEIAAQYAGVELAYIVSVGD